MADSPLATGPAKKLRPATKRPSADLEDSMFTGGGTWEAMLPFWPLEDRPEGVYRNKDWVNSQDLATLMKVQEMYEKRQRDQNSGGGVMKDQKPAIVNVKKFRDDHFEQLSDARFHLRRPLSSWDFWWPRMPKERKERYRGMDLVAIGMDHQCSRVAINR